ncbi:ArnT family glycosyltransferase [Nitrosopumilus sp. S4]
MKSTNQIIQNSNITKIIFIIIIISYIILSVTYSLITPTFEGPDEQFHYEHIRSILHDGNLKVDSTERAILFYLVSAFFLNFIEHPDTTEIPTNGLFPLADSNRFVHSSEELFPYSGTALAVHALRSISILCGLITIIFIYKISKIFFNDNNWLSLFVIINVVLIPRFVWSTSIISDDIWLWPFVTISIFYLMKYGYDQKNYKFLLLTSVFAGISILIKINGIVLIPIIFLTLLYFHSKTNSNSFNFIKNFLLFGIVSFFSGGWFFVYKILNKGNIPIVGNTLNEFSLNALSKPENSDFIQRFFDFEIIRWRSFDFAWSRFGWNNVFIEKDFIIFAEILAIISFGGLILILLKKIKNKNIVINSNNSFILIFTSIFFLLGLVIFYITHGAGVTRHIFPGISAYVILFTLGFSIFFYRKKLKFLMLIPIIFLIIVNFQIITVMAEEFGHGLGLEVNQKKCIAESRYIAMEELLKLYCSRPDIGKVFPNVLDGEYSELLIWASHNIEYKHADESFRIHYPFYLLMNEYYHDEKLKQKFPEAKNGENIEELLKWIIKNEHNYPLLKDHIQYYYNILKNSQ